MINEKEQEMLTEFNKLEDDLVSVLKTIPSNIDEEGKGEEKANIKSYMDKVNEAKKLFDKYEKIAKKLSKINSQKENDNDSIEFSKNVINLRKSDEFSKIDVKELEEQFQAVEKQTSGLDKVEIETMGETVVIKKRKKQSSQSSSSREF